MHRIHLAFAAIDMHNAYGSKGVVWKCEDGRCVSTVVSCATLQPGRPRSHTLFASSSIPPLVVTCPLNLSIRPLLHTSLPDCKMDEEENFAKLLSQSTTAAAPAWNAPAAEADPWANPFSDTTPSSNPFASPFGASSTYVPAPLSDPYTAPAASLSAPQSPNDGISPYVSKIEEDVRGGPDMPSVIAAREQAAIEPAFGDASRRSLDDDDIPFGQVRRDMSKPPAGDQGVQRKTLPSDLIDEELLAASDPSLSLKKAFVKSTPSATTGSASAKRDAGKADEAGKPKTYVFTPTKKGSALRESKEPVDVPAASEGKDSAGAVHSTDAKHTGSVSVDKVATTATEPHAQPSSGDTSTPKIAASIPLPDSVVGTPSTARALSPAPIAPAPPRTENQEQPEPSPLTAKTPSIDRVAVSPLDAPPQESDYGFQSLSIGASSIAPPVPPKSPLNETATEGWSARRTTPVTSNSPASRFGGKGWGALDDEDDGGLFGKGGPSVRSGKSIDNDPWGSGASNGDGGWGEPGVSSLPTPLAGSSSVSLSSTPLYASLTIGRGRNSRSRPLPDYRRFVDISQRHRHSTRSQGTLETPLPDLGGRPHKGGRPCQRVHGLHCTHADDFAALPQGRVFCPTQVLRFPVAL